MLDVREFMPADLTLLDAPDVPGMPDWRMQGYKLAAAGPAWTGVYDGRVIGCAGLGVVWAGRATAWCLLSQGIPKPAWVAIHRAVERLLEQARARGMHRIEAEVRMGWGPGVRWVNMLGFEQEGVARAFGPDGADYTRWVRFA